ncbi:MAG: hypothetical protein HY258_12425 [Chloroflexi bacterium]|nr:hypothetical protein [Chloroflexota bacterium]
MTPSVTWTGHTDNYIRVTTMSEKNLRNHITPIRITNLKDDGVVGIVDT